MTTQEHTPGNNYETRYLETFTTLLLQDPNLSKYSIRSIFDDRLLVQDDAGKSYFLPYKHIGNGYEFETIVPVEEDDIKESVIKQNLRASVKELVEGKDTETAIVNHLSELLKIDNDMYISKVSERTIPLIQFHKDLLEGVALPENLQIVATVQESTNSLVWDFYKWLKDKGYMLVPLRQVNAHDFKKWFEQYKSELQTPLTDLQDSMLTNYFLYYNRYMYENYYAVLKNQLSLNETNITDLLTGDNLMFNPSLGGQEVQADYISPNQAGNSPFGSYEGFLIDSKLLLDSLVQLELPDDLMQALQELLDRTTDYLTKINTGYQFSSIENIEFQDLVKALKELVDTLAGLDLLKYKLKRAEEEQPEDKTILVAKNSGTEKNMDSSENPDTLETTTTANIPAYPAKFYKNPDQEEIDSYPKPVGLSEKKVQVVDGAYFYEGKVASYNKWIGKYEVRLDSGKIIKVAEDKLLFI